MYPICWSIITYIFNPFPMLCFFVQRLESCALEASCIYPFTVLSSSLRSSYRPGRGTWECNWFFSQVMCRSSPGTNCKVGSFSPSVDAPLLSWIWTVLLMCLYIHPRFELSYILNILTTLLNIEWWPSSFGKLEGHHSIFDNMVKPLFWLAHFLRLYLVPSFNFT